MSFYLRKEWIDQVDGIDRVQIHYAAMPTGALLDDSRLQVRELIKETGGRRKRRGKVIKLPRRLDDEENYSLHYFFRVSSGKRETDSDVFVEEIVSDDTYTFIDYEGRYTNICVHWSIDGWGAPNYSTMFVDGIGLDHPYSSLHFYGRARDGIFIYERRKLLRTMPLPHVFRGRVHGPRSSRVLYCYHIGSRGDPDHRDYNFWDCNEGLNYQKTVK